MTNLLTLLRITITNVTICDDYLMNCIYTERHCFIKRLLLSSSFWVNGLEFNFPIHLTKKKEPETMRFHMVSDPINTRFLKLPASHYRLTQTLGRRD